MNTKNLFRTFFLLLAISFIGCSDDDEDISDVSLEQTEFRATAINTTYKIPITAGSGYYTLEIDDPAIADVSVQQDESGYTLVVFTKKEGETFVTLIDTKTGKFIVCSVSVKESTNEVPITGIAYGVDAGQREIILNDLEKREPFDIGYSVSINPFVINSDSGATGMWQVNRHDGYIIVKVPYVIEEKQDIPPYFFELLPIKKPIHGYSTYKIDDHLKTTYHVFPVTYGVSGNVTVGYIVILEDLTEQYKEKMPDLEIKAVVRAYTCNYWDK